MSRLKVDITDPELFGNEAGEDEPLERLSAYFLEKNSFRRFFSPQRKLAFVRSRKGVGKSALLRECLARRREHDEDEVLVYLKAQELTALQAVAGATPSAKIYEWQRRICTRLNLEIGARLRLALGDAGMQLVEQAELSGLRGRNIIGSLVDRIKLKIGDAEFGRRAAVTPNAESLLRRIAGGGNVQAWLLIDDVDATYRDTTEERLEVGTFFSACRNLVNSVKGLRIRASVRTDVWATITKHDESLDKCEQYMLDLRWSTKDSGKILYNKIKSYLESYAPHVLRDVGKGQREVFNTVFTPGFYWSGTKREVFRPIHILSGGRPRWAAQLCKLAGEDAARKNREVIGIGHISSVLQSYGEYRFRDLLKEHNHQCGSLESILVAFTGSPAVLSTEQLLQLISSKILRIIGTPKIDGEPAANGALSVAHFLFRIGFIAARDDDDKSGLSFVAYEDNPHLLRSTTNLDSVFCWEVHPSYRSFLRIQKDS